MKIGILGLQGCCVPHERKLSELGILSKRILYPEDLDSVDALILPGGESTTMLKVQTSGLWHHLLEFGSSHCVWGVCAGCILIAANVKHPEQASLGLLDIDLIRNAYGAQNESFIAHLQVHLPDPVEMEGVFIRAPMIHRVGEGLKVLCRHRDAPVAIEDERHLATTFHPELSNSTIIHEYFLEKVRRLQAI